MPFFDTATVLVVVLVLVLILGGIIILVGTGSTDPEWSRRGDRDRSDP
ncbi:MAG TPA: hypothetical protein VGV10_08035 [Thermoleophilaceae bacterium]|nr:hypothetical protein [Thermoleophilaceae bacterium]